MIHNLIITGIFALFLSSSCNNVQKKDNSITLVDIEANISNLKQINLSQFTENIKYVPLETKENLPFSWIAKIEFSENRIFVTDMSIGLLYDSEGRFVAKVGAQGRGPGEYEYISDVGIAPPKMIYLQSIFDLFEYNLDGLFVKKYKSSFRVNDNPDKYLVSWIIIDDSLYFGHVPNSTGRVQYKALIINKYGDIKYKHKNYILYNREKPVASGYEDFAHIFQFKGSVFYNELFNDTLFSLNAKYELIPSYFFNLGKLKMPGSDGTLHRGPMMAKYIFIWDVFQTDNYLFLNCDFGNRFPVKRITPITLVPGTDPVWYNTKYVLGLYNKITSELVFCKPTSTDNSLYTSGIYNDIDAGPRFFPKKQINDSTMVMWVTPDKLKAHVACDDFKNNVPKYPEKKKQLEEFANSLSETDNPVLMFVTFKK
jgi:hypothetical protein